MSAVMAAMGAAGATWSARPTRSTGTRRSNATTCRTRTAGAWVPGAAGAIGEGCREHTLQLGGLIAGQLAAGHFAGNQGVDLRLQVAGRSLGAAGRASRAIAL